MPIIRKSFTHVIVHMEYIIGGMPIIKGSFTHVIVCMELISFKNNGIHWKLQQQIYNCGPIGAHHSCNELFSLLTEEWGLVEISSVYNGMAAR